jgi:hypothetical protein
VLQNIDPSQLDVTKLEDMTMAELRALKDAVDNAIRAAIARDRVERTQRAAPGAAVQPVDLERERDAWTAARKAN